MVFLDAALSLPGVDRDSLGHSIKPKIGADGSRLRPLAECHAAIWLGQGPLIFGKYRREVERGGSFQESGLKLPFDIF